MEKMLPNIDLGKTQITPEIRVSSAAIFYKSWFGDYYQLETFIFSDNNELQKSRQVIHGTCGREIPLRLQDKIKKIHAYISKNLCDKYTTS